MRSDSLVTASLYLGLPNTSCTEASRLSASRLCQSSSKPTPFLTASATLVCWEQDIQDGIRSGVVHLVPVDGNANDGSLVTYCLLGTSCTTVSDEQLHLEKTILILFSTMMGIGNIHQPLDEQAGLAVAAKKTQAHWKARLAYQPPTVELS